MATLETLGQEEVSAGELLEAGTHLQSQPQSQVHQRGQEDAAGCSRRI